MINISGMEKFSMVDYPEKIACTLFTEGCNYCCPFCQNAALVLGSGAPGIPEEEIFEYLKKRKGLVDAVCITGGEPTLHKGLAEFCTAIKRLGYPIKLDTNGTAPDVIRDLNENGLIDYVAMDIKNSPAKYALTAGVDKIDTAAIFNSAQYLMRSGIGYEFRTTLVAGFHEEEDFEEIARRLAGAKRYYLQKFSDRNGCLVEGLKEVPIEKARIFKRILATSIETVELRGY